MVCERTARRLNEIAQKKGIRVVIAGSTHSRNTWYSVCMNRVRHHQMYGSDSAKAIENYIDSYGIKK